MAIKASERRKNPRFECELVACVFPPDGEGVGGDSVDLSRGGMALRLRRAIEIGTDVEVLLTLHFGWTETDFLRLRGTVVWAREESDGLRVGVEFEESQGFDQDRLALLIRAIGSDELREWPGGQRR